MVYAGGKLALFGGYANPPLNDLWLLSHPTLAAGEACSSGVDYDRDGKIGCMDDECWQECTPLCPPQSLAATCPAMATVGDGMCTGLETCRTASECSCPVTCGDDHCEAPETLATCPGDCAP